MLRSSVLLLLLSNCSAISIHDSDNLLASQSPEEQQVSESDIYAYSTIISGGENLSDIKQRAEDL